MIKNFTYEDNKRELSKDFDNNEKNEEEYFQKSNEHCDQKSYEDYGTYEYEKYGENFSDKYDSEAEKLKKKKKKKDKKNIKDILNNKKYIESYLNPYVSNNVPSSVDENKFFFCYLKIEIIEDDGVRIVKKNLINKITPTRFSVNARPEKGRKKVAFKHEAYVNKSEEYISRNSIDISNNFINKNIKFVGITNDSDKYMIEYCKQKIIKKDKSLLCLDNRKLVAKICSKNKIPILWIRIDNDFFILGRIRRSQSISMWIQQLFNDNNIFSQLESSFALAYIPFFYLNKNFTSNFGEYKNNDNSQIDNNNNKDKDNIGESSINFIKSVLNKNKIKNKKSNLNSNNMNSNISSNDALNNDLLNGNFNLEEETSRRHILNNGNNDSLIPEKKMNTNKNSKKMLNNLIDSNFIDQNHLEINNDKEKLISNLHNDFPSDLLKDGNISSQTSSSLSESDSYFFNLTTSTIDDFNEEYNSSIHNYSTNNNKRRTYKKKWKSNISVTNIPINVEVIKCLYKSITCDYLHYLVKIRCIYSLCFIHNKYLCTQKIIQNLFCEYLTYFYGNNLNQKKFMHAFYIAMSLLRNKNNRTPKIIIFLLTQKCINFVFSLKLDDTYKISKDTANEEEKKIEKHYSSYNKNNITDNKEGDVNLPCFSHPTNMLEESIKENYSKKVHKINYESVLNNNKEEISLVNGNICILNNIVDKDEQKNTKTEVLQDCANSYNIKKNPIKTNDVKSCDNQKFFSNSENIDSNKIKKNAPNSDNSYIDLNECLKNNKKTSFSLSSYIDNNDEFINNTNVINKIIKITKEYYNDNNNNNNNNNNNSNYSYDSINCYLPDNKSEKKIESKKKKNLYEKELILKKEEEEDIKIVLECLGNIKFKQGDIYKNYNNNMYGLINYYRSKDNKENLFYKYFSNLENKNNNKKKKKKIMILMISMI